jgi:cytochrome P450/CRP-like cAMP-binding protein
MALRVGTSGRQAHEGRRPPLVRGWPLVGSVLALLRDPMRLLVASYLEHGPIFRLHAAHRRFTVLAGPEANLFLARGGMRRLSSVRAYQGIAKNFDSPNMVVGVDGARHLHMRRLLRPAYSRELVERNLPRLAEGVERIVLGLPRGRPVPLRTLMQRLIFEQLAIATLGHSGAEIFETVRLYTSTVVGVGLGAWSPLRLLDPRYRMARAFCANMSREMIERRRAGTAVREDIVDLAGILLAAGDLDGKPFGDGDLLAGVTGPYTAGMDTAASTAAFLAYELLRQPQLLERALAELDQAFADGLPSAQGLRQMRVLRHAYLEALRLYPINVLVPRHAAEDFEFGGYRVAAGEEVMVAATVSHFLPDFYPDPHRFDIERFGDPRNEDRQAGAFAPYGIGAHTCVGAGQAELLVMLALAVLLRMVRAELHPAGYVLRPVVSPLPAPEEACAIRVVEQRASLTQAAAQARARQQVAMVLPTLDRKLLADMAARVVARSHVAGAVIVREGEVADRFFMILDGEVEVSQGAATVARLGSGRYFGEIGLLTGAPRNATVRATTEVTVMELDREGFLTMVEECDLTSQELARMMRERVVANQLTLALPSLDAGQAAALAPRIERQRFAAGEAIVRQGDPAHHFYILVRGGCEVSCRRPEGPEVSVGQLVEGDFFGETGLLLGVPRTATVRAGDQGAEVLSLDRDGFRALTGPADLTHEEIARVMRRRMEARPA